MYLLYLLFSLSLLSPDKNEWVSYFENSQVKVFYKKADCIDANNGVSQRKVLLKFQNLTSGTLEVTFSKKLHYLRNNVESKAGSDKNVLKVILQPGMSLEGSCENRDKSLFIFEKFLDKTGAELKSFDLENINVTIKK